MRQKTTGESKCIDDDSIAKKTQKETCSPEMPGFPHQSYTKKEEYISFAEVTNNFNKVH